MLEYRLFSEPFDLTRMREALEVCLQIAAQPGFTALYRRRLQPADADLATEAALDGWILAHAATGHHVSSTCRMGPARDPMAVVDQYGKVHGVDRLRVVDAATMPDTVRANINATVMMMAERLAALIRGGR